MGYWGVLFDFVRAKRVWREEMNTKDEKKEKIESKDKKRGFLKPISLAISALLTSPFITHLGVSKADVLDTLNQSREASETRTRSEAEPLIITSASQLAQQQTAQHESHYSHYSHESHASHVSHYSSSF